MNELCQLVAILSPTILSTALYVIYGQQQKIKKLTQANQLSQSKYQLLQAYQLEVDGESK